MALPLVCFNMYCPGGGMVDTLVLETSAERRGGSSLPWGTNNGEMGERLIPADCKSALFEYSGSNPLLSTK